MRIKFITTGGTIDKVYFDTKSEFQVGESYLDSLLLRANVSFEYRIESVLKKDSLELTDSDRKLIVATAENSTEDKIVITHGTDTIKQSAMELKSISAKTIVLTGSMQPARFHDSDAVFNIGTAVAAVQTLPHGVYLAMNGRVFDPAQVEKNVGENRFEDK